jgi:8-oxo-dGTP pyrophosphatase MutT (NUDIX family)
MPGMEAERPSQDELRRRVLEDRPSFTVPVDPPEDPVPARDSATVMLVRDGADGLEVFMLERHLNSDFAGGAYVFPGGTIDPRDLDPDAATYLDGVDAAEAAERIHAPKDRARAFYLCAIRETFEEAGVLLARRDSLGVRFDDPAEEKRFALYRAELNARGGSLAMLAKEEDLRYSGDLLHYYARWITPEFAPKRYDARFFVATMLEGQSPLHDDVETTASTWIRPADALSRAADGLFSIIFPTRKTLESLAAFASADEVIASTRGKEIPALLPKVVLADGQPRVVLPGDSTLHEP